MKSFPRRLIHLVSATVLILLFFAVTPRSVSAAPVLTGLSARETVAGGERIELTWTNNHSAPITFNVGVIGGSGANLVTKNFTTNAAATRSHVVPVTGLKPSTTYSISVSFNVVSGPAGESQTITYTTGPSIVVATPGGGNGGSGAFSVTARPDTASPTNSIRLQWLPHAGATKYKVYYQRAGDSRINSVDVTTTGRTLSSLATGASYSITVQALSASNSVLASANTTVSTQAETCTVSDLSSNACRSPEACRAAGGISHASSGIGGGPVCYSETRYCTTVLGGTWGSVAAGAMGCRDMDAARVCVAAGLEYSEDLGQCVGSASSCDTRPAVGGVRSVCQQLSQRQESQNQATGVCGTNTSGFLGLPTWYKYLKLDPQSCEVTNFCVLEDPSSGCERSTIPLVVLALVEIAMRIGSIIAVAFVIIGGIKFVTSQGEPDGVKNARNTILNALVGLVITIVATPVISFIGNSFGG